ncbi:MAG: VOC family protein [Cytophagales bacterium]|nr:VOC family protein [Cytophagales bacterium]
MMVIRFDHISLFVSDLEKSMDFYSHFLKLKQIDRPAFDFPGAWYQLGPDVQLHLIAGREKHSVVSGSRKNHFALLVEDIFDLEQKAIQRGLSYVGPKKRPDGAWQLFVQDPDGYFIEFGTPL